MRAGRGSRHAIDAALLEFQAAPGRHAIASQQPAALFSSMRDVLQIAAGRSPDENDPPPASAVIDAARFFVRTALLMPDASHYALLGLNRSAESSEIKDRYRLLMRLLHPDFAESPSAAAWPADAATRVNRAYEVLSSPDKRKEYDEAISPQPPAPFNASSHPAAAARAASAHGSRAAPTDPRAPLRWLAWGFGAIGGVALLGAWVAGSQSERESLVQRSITKPAPANDAAAIVPSPVSAPPNAIVSTAESLSAAITQALPSILQAPDPAPAPAPAITIAPSALAAPLPAPTAAPLPIPIAVSASAPEVSPVRAEPAALVAQAPAPAPAVAPAPSPAPAPAPVPPPPPAPAIPRAPAVPPAASISMADVQQQLTSLLQQIESGWSDNVLRELSDRSARNSPAAQAFARQYDLLVDGSRPVTVVSSSFRGDARDGRLIVSGLVVLEVRGGADRTRRFQLVAEFVDRNGTPALVRLSLP